jgi:hypothetical protein
VEQTEAKGTEDKKKKKIKDLSFIVVTKNWSTMLNPSVYVLCYLRNLYSNTIIMHENIFSMLQVKRKMTFYICRHPWNRQTGIAQSV